MYKYQTFFSYVQILKGITLLGKFQTGIIFMEILFFEFNKPAKEMLSVRFRKHWRKILHNFRDTLYKHTHTQICTYIYFFRIV